MPEEKRETFPLNTVDFVTECAPDVSDKEAVWELDAKCDCE
jgi:hypothetical protein